MRHFNFRFRNLQITLREWFGFYATCCKRIFTFGCAVGDATEFKNST